MSDSSVQSKKFIWLHRNDNVAVALTDLLAGDVIHLDGGDLVLRQPIDYGHKFAVRDIPEGDPVIKYGETIGAAVVPIAVGDHVHVHNIKSLRAQKP